MLHALLDALSLAFGMAREILWALILGFLLSAVVQAEVSKVKTARPADAQGDGLAKPPSGSMLAVYPPGVYNHPEM